MYFLLRDCPSFLPENPTKNAADTVPATSSNAKNPAQLDRCAGPCRSRFRLLSWLADRDVVDRPRSNVVSDDEEVVVGCCNRRSWIRRNKRCPVRIRGSRI